MAVVAPESSAEKIIESSQSMEPSHSRRASDAASDSSSICATLDPSDQYNSSPNPHKDVEIQSLTSLRSEEYRQLFRLPPEEVLIQDFNCAFQENILLQGHMYVFSHYICFYSNIFGFETKKAIPFHEVTCVRRAKTAGIFPNAIEIIAGGKKNFFASFLSRDEAFKIINDGWLQHSNGGKAVTEQQDSISESISQENGLVVIEKVTSSKCSVTESDSVDRNKDAPILNDSNLPSKVEDDIALTMLSELQNNVEEEAEPVLNSDSSSGKTEMWMEENSDAPKVPDCYTRVAETKFSIKVEDFFSFFYSDDAVNFIESFHRSCGDKDFRCTSWYPHDKFGHARDVSFQHPIKLYFGAKFGSCQEVQKFRVYRHSHLVIETSQEINDVPYGDYFRVEGLWDVERDGDESKDCCVLRVYVNVAFSKKTVWRGKIVQSTVEECREAYASWVKIAHELLKQKNLAKQEEGDPNASMIENDQVHFESQVENGEHLERSNEANDVIRIPQMSDSKNVNQQVDNLVQGNLICSTTISSLFKESMVKFYASVKSQGHLPLLLVIIFVVILLLMQLSIVVLLTRPQQVHVISQADFMNSMGSGVGERSSEMLAWLEKRIYHLKDEILMVEARLEKMRQEHTLIKAQLKDLELLKKRI